MLSLRRMSLMKLQIKVFWAIQTLKISIRHRLWAVLLPRPQRIMKIKDSFLTLKKKSYLSSKQKIERFHHLPNVKTESKNYLEIPKSWYKSLFKKRSLNLKLKNKVSRDLKLSWRWNSREAIQQAHKKHAKTKTSKFWLTVASLKMTINRSISP